MYEEKGDSTIPKTTGKRFECVTCEGCVPGRCAFAEGYSRAQNEMKSKGFNSELEMQLVTILQRHCGERGDNEGALDTLNRIIYERETLLRDAISEKLFKIRR